jgi:hypothetical protein
MKNELLENFEKELDQTEWLLLEPHHNKETLYYISNGIELTEVAMKIAQDDVKAIKQYLDQSTMSKPTSDQIKLWKEEPLKQFNFLIIQPYVIFNEILN